MRLFHPLSSASLFLALFLAACGGEEAADPHMAAAVAGADFERGPHNGRLLEQGDFALEVTVFEAGVPPEYRIYPFHDGEPVNPAEVQLVATVSRLGGQVDQFAFAPEQDFLRAQSVLVEPHSFDVSISAAYAGQQYQWAYQSYEGRTIIAREVADASGVVVEEAGPAELEETVRLSGRVELLPEGRADLRARYPGRVVAISKHIGEPVSRGEVLARVEASDSLQTYAITAPFDGVVAEQNASVESLTGDEPLYVVMDPDRLHAELFLFPRDAASIRPGQKVEVRSASGESRIEATIESILAVPDATTPMRVAHVELPPGTGEWWPGIGIDATVTIGVEEVPLAVRTRALQPFRDFTVVYARYGDTYEVRMLELGRQTPEWTEILGGLDAGTPYVTDNAFLIRADVEKSGATHDH